MVKLKKLLSDELKILRHRRLTLNIQITTLNWILELVLSFMAILVTLIGVGIQKYGLSFFVQELILFVYTVFLQAFTLINDTELKDNIIQSDWYISILDTLGWTYKGPRREENHTDKISSAEPNEVGYLGKNEEERNVEGKEAVEIDGQNSNVRRINPKVISTTRNDIKEKISLRKSYHCNDCEIIDLDVSNKKSKAIVNVNSSLIEDKNE